MCNEAVMIGDVYMLDHGVDHLFDDTRNTLSGLFLSISITGECLLAFLTFVSGLAGGYAIIASALHGAGALIIPMDY